jgi:Ser/Thr protein kinase RdoA (MazF antagonist)
MKPDRNVLDQFNLKGEIEFLPGGEGRTYRVGNIVLKHINNDTEEYTNWIADLFAGIKESGFSISKPVANTKGMWITENGWAAWTFLEGDHNFTGHISESIEAITAFHEEIKNVGKPKFLDNMDSPYARADAYAWGDKPEAIHPALEEIVDDYYALRKPVVGMEDQIIHGDLNPDNILLSTQRASGHHRHTSLLETA